MAYVEMFIRALIAALIYMFGGYAKNTPLESFSAKKAVVTFAVSIVISLIMTVLGISPEEALAQLEYAYANILQILTTTGLITVIEFYGKAIIRRLTGQEET